MQIRGGRGVRECAHRDEVDAQRGDIANRVQRDAARDPTSARLLDCGARRTDLIDRHIVEQDDVRAASTASRAPETD
jgi:hypothetical protein